MHKFLNIIRLNKIKMCLILLLFLINIIFILSNLNKYIITSKYVNLSPGSFSYICFVLYNHEENTSNIVNKIKKNIAKAGLASKHKIFKDPNYQKYRFIGRRSRYNKAFINLFIREFGKNFSFNDAYNKYKINLDYNNAANIICSNRIKKNYNNILINKPLIIGTWIKGNITLDMLKKNMLDMEWELFIALDKIPMKDALKEKINQWLYSVANDELIKEFKAIKEELAFFDHIYVADRFLITKYAMALEGIYPAKKLEINFTQKELLDYFNTIKYSFCEVKRLKLQFTIVKDMNDAKFFKEQLQNTTFYELSEKYAVSEQYIKTANPHYLDHENSSLNYNNYFNQYILNYAQKNILNPSPFFVKNGVMILKILKIDRVDKKLNFKDYAYEVKNQLTQKILKRQYPIDIIDTMNNMDFKYYPENALY